MVGTNLVAGLSKSCGCLKNEIIADRGRRNRKHGLSRTRIYALWKQMVRRCTNPLAFDFHYYGGRGIKVHTPWMDPATFVRDVEAEIGPCPSGMTLDRIDNAGDYAPGNVRWASRATQSANRGGKPQGGSVQKRIRVRKKLTAEQVRQLVEFVQSGHSYAEAAEIFPVSGGHVSRVYRETAGSALPKRRRRVF
ncbi:hypothetical protein ACFOY2_05425 [Nonomuraea purpurea]|uniref:Uncharacterized protein n=1 Tax=Nonomuraea purpurea TaxID=1849276 RepID=A0ABV8FY37_9ACTN